MSDKYEAMHRLLPLIERAAKEANQHLALHQHFAGAAKKPVLELAGGRMAALNGNGAHVPSQSAQQTQMAQECAGLAQAHLNDMFKFCGELQKALQETK